MKKEARNEMTGYPSIDRPWLKYYSDEAINVEIPHMTAYDYIHKINKCASQFAQLGVGKGNSRNNSGILCA